MWRLITIAAVALGAAAAGPAFADPVGVWRFEDRIAVRCADETGHGNVAREVRTATSGPRLRPARSAMGGGVQFPGGNAHLRVTEAHSFAMAAGDSFTIEAWVSKLRTAGHVQTIAARGVPGAAGSWALQVGADGIAVGDVCDASGNRCTVSGGAAITDGRRHRVVFVRDTATDSFRLYVDDTVPVATAGDTTTAAFASGQLLLGGAESAGGGTTSHLAGVLDELRVDRGVADLYRGDPSRDVLGVWRSDEGNGTSAADSSPHGNHASLATTGAGGAPPAWAPEGVLGKSLHFDGAGSVADVAEAASIAFAADESWAVSAWVRAGNSPGLRGVVSRRARGATAGLSVRLAPSGTLAAEASDGAGASVSLTTRRPLRGIAARSFHHVVLVRDREAGEFRLVLDGVVRASASDAAAGAIGSGAFRIGALTGATPSEDAPFQGWIDEVAVVKWGGAPTPPPAATVLFASESDSITQDWFRAHGENVLRIDRYPTAAELVGVRLLYVETYDVATAADRQAVRDFIAAGGSAVFDSGSPLFFSSATVVDPIFGSASYTNAGGPAALVTAGPVMTSVLAGASLGSEPGAGGALIVSPESTSTVLASWTGSGRAQTTLGPWGSGECAFVSQGPGYSLHSAAYDTWWGDLMTYLLRDRSVSGTVATPQSASGFIQPGDEIGGVVADPEAGWDGDFSTACSALSNGHSLKAITWITDEVFRIPGDAQNVRVRGKVESQNWQSHASVMVWDHADSEWHVLAGGELAGDGIHEATSRIGPTKVSNGEVRIRAVLFAKHSTSALARYFGSAVLYGSAP